MTRYRGTYAKIYVEHIRRNVEKIINQYHDYSYYMGVVKADCYGHLNDKCIQAMIQGGINFLCVSSLEEALMIRKNFQEIPILCFGVVNVDALCECVKHDIRITIVSEEYVDEILQNKDNLDLANLKVHIKLDTGMNRLGIKEKEEFIHVLDKISNTPIFLEGIYTHIANASDQKETKMQFRKFDELLEKVDLNKIKIIHVPNSQTLVSYEKIPYVNGFRIGILMYGFSDSQDLPLQSTFSVVSQIVQIKVLKKGEKVGYDGAYQATKKEKIGIVSIGYADGIPRSMTGNMVYIHGKEYQIVGKICMDMLMVKVDEQVKLYDEVMIFKDKEHMKKIAQNLGTIPYELLCDISKRVVREYV